LKKLLLMGDGEKKLFKFILLLLLVFSSGIFFFLILSKFCLRDFLSSIMSEKKFSLSKIL
jgi:hypothetical protein